MQKKVFMVHGWDGSPENCWFPWLKTQLEGRGFSVQVLSMPHPENPTIADWVGHIAGVVGEPNENMYFVGHSIGCQAILRYVGGLDAPVGGIVCVAGFFRLLHLATEEEKAIAKPWLETPMDYGAVQSKAGAIIALFSDDDPDVALGDKELFEKYLGAKIVVEHGKGHFSDDDGVTKLPFALDAVLEIAGEK